MKAALPEEVRLIVNDRIEVAIEAGISGVHIGQSDGDPRKIRGRIGPTMMLGLSIEHEDQLQAVPRDWVDYLGVGPVRATATKPDHAPPIGLAGLREIVRMAGLPCVAIGGIGPGDCAAIRATGAAGIAVVSAIARAEDPELAARALAEEWSTP